MGIKVQPPSAGSGSGTVVTGTTVPTDIPAGSLYVQLDGSGNPIDFFATAGGFGGQVTISASEPGASIPANSLYVQTDGSGAVTNLYAGAA